MNLITRLFLRLVRSNTFKYVRMAVRYTVYVALFVVVLVIICSRSSHGYPTNNKVEGDMDGTGAFDKGGGQSKQLQSNEKGEIKLIKQCLLQTSI